MNIIEVERGKTLNAPFHWVDFVIANPDIMAALNPSPLRAKKITGKKYLLTIFGVKVALEELHQQVTDKQGTRKSLANVRLPWGLGRTHTVSHYNYHLIDENTTAVELSLSIELPSLMTKVYATLCRNRIEHYLNRVCQHTEHAAQQLDEEKEETLGTLDNVQKLTIRDFRRSIPSRQPVSKQQEMPILEGALRIVISDTSLFVTAEARLPDRSILSANRKVNLTPEEQAAFCVGMTRLAGINNRALVTRGNPTEASSAVDFRQAALEHGYRFYQRICSEQLLSVVPAITSVGRAALLRISVEGEAEHLPWEIMHDGQDFLCIKTCLSRCVTTINEQKGGPRDWQRAGVLIVGADARGDLPGVEQEAKGIGRILTSAGVSNVEVLAGIKASRRSVLKALQSGEFGILHFSGHSVFDETHPNQSYLELCSATKIFLHELGHFGRPGSQNKPLGLVFLNSCQSARIGHDSVTGRQLSMCKALRESGVGYVIGMMWNVEDEAAVQVGAGFYTNLMECPSGGPEGAMRETRLAVAMERAWADGSWLAPVLYS
jgi:CHAT domain-containing protein